MTQNTNIQKIAKILKTPEKVMSDIFRKMDKITGKSGMVDKIKNEIDEKIIQRKSGLGLDGAGAEEIFQALIEKTSQINKKLFELFRAPEFNTQEGCKTLINFAKEISSNDKVGFFLKYEKAEELIRSNPPQNILEFLEYKNINDLLKKEDLEEVFCALRFGESIEWLNKVFMREYQHLTKDDFEKRPIKVIVLSEKWRELGEKFMGHKLHNISHLKELGLLFSIPTEKNFDGQTIETFTLLVHYLHEIDFYSKIIEKYSKKNNFGQRLISLLRGEISKENIYTDEENIMNWRIIQRYLAKDDASDPRLFEPHVNPETIHYVKVASDLKKMSERFPDVGLQFWNDQSFVADYFVSEQNQHEVLVSFNLVDNIISLAKKSQLDSVFIYHQQEALWNKIFEEYMGWDALQNLTIDNFEKGIIEL